MNNHVYDLMSQLTEESKSLWRIKKYYETDAGECTECQLIWSNMIADKERAINELKTALKRHLNID